MDACDDFRLSDHQKIVVTLDVLTDVSKTFASIIGFFQLMTLDECAHAAIKNMNTLLHILLQGRDSLLTLLDQVVVV